MKLNELVAIFSPPALFGVPLIIIKVHLVLLRLESCGNTETKVMSEMLLPVYLFSLSECPESFHGNSQKHSRRNFKNQDQGEYKTVEAVPGRKAAGTRLL